MLLQSAGPAVYRAKSFAILCSVFWLGELALLALELFLKTQS